MPAPNPTSSTRSPGWRRPASAASARASGIDAAEVLPVVARTLATWSVGMPSLGDGRVDDAGVGLVGDEQRDVVDGDAGLRSSARSADSTMIRTARRNTSGPSISMVPPLSASRMWRSEPSEPRSQPSSRPGPSPRSSTTAPAPSPNRMAVPRSSQSTIVDIVSAPIEEHALHAGAQEPVGGDQAVDEAGAGGVEVEGAAA